MPLKSTKARKNKRQTEAAEVTALEVKANDPSIYADSILFSELPISARTQEGLKRANFLELTDIQRKAIPLALAGKDVLGAAKTGSGKTLAFLVPILELLYRAKWSQFDGLGALVISPTRELAVQIFEVLKKIGRQHSLSAGLIIGGKDLTIEQERVNRMNILVCTPGRLLQHMDQTAGFECDNLKLLVLDEADRILDMGFEKTLNAIIDNLPRQRQTLLFSATQTKSVRDLARLSLKEPEYVAVHEKSEFSTPQRLSQHYLVCDLPQKLDILFSFVKTHLTSKAIVFFTSCKQVRFAFEAFCRLHPGVPLLHLYGKQKQTKRVEIFSKFISMKSAFLFATDIAARGLDFPAVDWVLQLDCPENADTYIHRVGRTARFDAAGQALLFLVPSEEQGMLEQLKKKRVPVEKIKVRRSKQQSVRKQLQSLCFQNPEIKYLGQKAFVSYMRSVYLQKDKSIFKVQELPAVEYATALGLPGTPKIKFVMKSEAKNIIRQHEKFEESDSSEEEESEEEIQRILEEKEILKINPSDVEQSELEENEESKFKPNKKELITFHIGEESENTKFTKPKNRVERMFSRQNQDILSEHYGKLVDHEGDKFGTSDDDDDFMTLKRMNHELESREDEEILPMSKRQLNKTKKERTKGLPKGKRVVFDEEGKPHQIYEMQNENEFLKAGDVKTQIRKFMQDEVKIMQEADAADKEVAKGKRRQKKVEKKAKAREMEDGGQSKTIITIGNDVYEAFSEDDKDIAMQYSDSGPEEEIVPITKVKRWFQNEDNSTSKKKRVIGIEQPQTLEDQEALALRLLGSSL